MRWKVKQTSIKNKSVIEVLLENRNIDRSFFKKYNTKDLKNPFDFYNMHSAVQRIKQAIEKKEKIFIHGDFDVDGTAATAILWDYLFRHRKADVMPYIPHRVDEGYGMSIHTFDKLISQGAKLIISVDCGIKDIDLVNYAQTKGVDVIITDHHEFVYDNQKNPVLPDTIVIHGMHPLATEKNIICGGVTAWKLVCALENEYTGESYNEVTLSYLDLAAITTLSDIMPLTNENRVIVTLGLESMRNNTLRTGLDELIKISQIDKKNINTYHIGFMLGPRLNAPGRMENSAMNSLRLLCTAKKSQAKILASHLDMLNKKRQDITEQYIKEVEKQISVDSKIIFAHGTDWPEGVLGLVAGKIAEKYYKPTFVLSYNSREKKVTGSARSIKYFHLVKALDECKDCLLKYGGHYMAAGFSLLPDNILLLKNKLLELAETILNPEQLIPELPIDCYLNGSQLKADLYEQIQQLSPFGYGNTTPIFASLNVKLLSIKYMGNNNQHVKMVWNIDNTVVDSIVFNCNDEWKNLRCEETYNIAYNVDINEWNGKRNIQLGLKDIQYE